MADLQRDQDTKARAQRSDCARALLYLHKKMHFDASVSYRAESNLNESK